MTKTAKTKPKIFLSKEQQALLVKFSTVSEREKMAKRHNKKPSVLKKILWRQYPITEGYSECVEDWLSKAKSNLNNLKQAV